MSEESVCSPVPACGLPGQQCALPLWGLTPSGAIPSLGSVKVPACWSLWWEGEPCLSPPVPSRHIRIDLWDAVSAGGSKEGVCDGVYVLLLLFSSQKETSLWGHSHSPHSPPPMISPLGSHRDARLGGSVGHVKGGLFPTDGLLRAFQNRASLKLSLSTECSSVGSDRHPLGYKVILPLSSSTGSKMPAGSLCARVWR